MGRRSRGAREKRPPNLKPVQRIEVSEKHFSRRMIIFLICLTVAVAALSYGAYFWLNGSPGWQLIEVSSGELSVAADFSFEYYVGSVDGGPSVSKRQVQALYTRAAVHAYQQFSTVDDISKDGESVHNLWYINSHPNQDIEVDPVLYAAFQKAAEHGDRSMYLGILNTVYQDIFSCQEDWETEELDPISNPEAAEFAAELAAFAKDESQVDLKLMEGNRVRLYVSEEYLSYAEDLDRSDFLDFGWQRNAYIVDYLADSLISAGYVNGVISSIDGFTRSLGGLSVRQAYSACDWQRSSDSLSEDSLEGSPGRPIVAARAEFEGGVNLVSMCAFPVNSRDEDRFYVFESGDVRHPYVSIDDGVCRACAASMAVYSKELGCAEMAILAGQAFIDQELSEDRLTDIVENQAQLIAVCKGEILYTQEDLALDSIYNQGEKGDSVESGYSPRLWKD